MNLKNIGTHLSLGIEERVCCVACAMHINDQLS